MPTNRMKAIRLHAFGGPEVLVYEDVAIPELRPGEVLVRVHAVGVNPPDWYLRDGYRTVPNFKPPVTLPVIPGSDVSGVVAAVAPDVQGFTVGDEVFGMIRFPSFGDSAAYAEYVAAPASDLARKPAGIDHVHAAGAPMSALTAWQFLVETWARRAEPVPAGAASPGAARRPDGARQRCRGRRGAPRGPAREMAGCARHRSRIERAGNVPA